MNLVEQVEKETKTARRIARLLEEHESDSRMRVLEYVGSLIGESMSKNLGVSK